MRSAGTISLPTLPFTKNRLRIVSILLVAVVFAASCTGSKLRSDSDRARQIREYLMEKYAHTTGEWLTPVANRTNGPGTGPTYVGVAQPGRIDVAVQLDTAVIDEKYAQNGDGSLYAYGPSPEHICEAVLDGHFHNINHVRVIGLTTVECP